MVHQVGYWHTVLGLTIPQAVTMTGGNYLSPKMQPPDVMDVTMRHAEKLLFTWNSMFSNDYYGEGHDLLLGTKGTIVHDPTDKPRYLPQGGKATKPADARNGFNRRLCGRHRRAHAELLRLRAKPEGTELPVRDRVPKCHRLPDGGPLLPRGPNRDLGREARGDCLGLSRACRPLKLPTWSARRARMRVPERAWWWARRVVPGAPTDDLCPATSARHHASPRRTRPGDWSRRPR